MICKFGEAVPVCPEPATPPAGFGVGAAGAAAGWIYFDGAEPEHIRPLLDALRDLPPSTLEDKQRMSRRLFEKLDAELARQGEPPVATAAPAAPIARAPGERRVGEGGVTARSPSFDERPAAPPPAEPPSLPVDAREPRPSTGRPAENLTTTALVVEIPAEFREQMGRLPFKPRAPGTELARTMQSLILNPRQGETVPLGDDSIAKAVAALPFAGNTVGAAVVPFPQLPLQAYASLRAKLSLWPERSAEILPRYYVMNEAACRALDEHWQTELTASTEARATFDKLLADYMAWLHPRFS